MSKGKPRWEQWREGFDNTYELRRKDSAFVILYSRCSLLTQKLFLLFIIFFSWFFQLFFCLGKLRSISLSLFGFLLPSGLFGKVKSKPKHPREGTQHPRRGPARSFNTSISKPTPFLCYIWSFLLTLSLSGSEKRLVSCLGGPCE